MTKNNKIFWALHIFRVSINLCKKEYYWKFAINANLYIWIIFLNTFSVDFQNVPDTSKLQVNLARDLLADWPESKCNFWNVALFRSVKVNFAVQATSEANKEFSRIAYCARLRDGKDQRCTPASATDWNDVRLP